MVHLSAIPTEQELQTPVLEGLDKLSFELGKEEDTFSASVYGTRYAACELPRAEMPEKEMPREVAYRMIK
jgi:glutamate decarboxylase